MNFVNHCLGMQNNWELCFRKMELICPSIYPSIILLSITVTGKLEPIPADFRWEVGLFWGRLGWVIYTHWWCRVARWPNIHMFGLWKKTGVPHTGTGSACIFYTENIQSANENLLAVSQSALFNPKRRLLHCFILSLNVKVEYTNVPNVWMCVSVLYTLSHINRNTFVCSYNYLINQSYDNSSMVTGQWLKNLISMTLIMESLLVYVWVFQKLVICCWDWSSFVLY